MRRDYLKTWQVARYCGVSSEAVCRLYRSGVLPPPPRDGQKYNIPWGHLALIRAALQRKIVGDA